MIHTNQKASYFLQIGDRRGAVRCGRRWVGFRCVICAKEMYGGYFDKGVRWQGPPTKAIWAAVEEPEIRCFPEQMHTPKKEGRT